MSDFVTCFPQAPEEHAQPGEPRHPPDNNLLAWLQGVQNPKVRRCRAAKDAFPPFSRSLVQHTQPGEPRNSHVLSLLQFFQDKQNASKCDVSGVLRSRCFQRLFNWNVPLRGRFGSRIRSELCEAPEAPAADAGRSRSRSLLAIEISR